MSVSGVPDRLLCRLLCIGLIIFLQACSAARDNPLPRELVATAQVPNIDRARFWGDKPPPYARQWLQSPEQTVRRQFGGIMGREHDYLALSGGGQQGAFGAGLLAGWSEAGTRPRFTLVTGISTGALIAPFAYLGPAYDAKLKEIYTQYSTEDLIVQRGPLAMLTSDAMSDTARLKAMIARYMDASMLKAIAAEHRKGRILYIGTTDLDAARPVIWNIGRIAASGEPGALQLVRDIMLASASIPGAFPPVPIEVEAAGRRYQELHVDGGASSQVFLYPLGLDWAQVMQKVDVRGKPRLYIIRNAYLQPRWEQVRPRTLSIARRTISSLIRTQGVGDMYRIYLGALRDGIEFNLAYIPDDFEAQPQEPFDIEYMRQLFEFGYRMARVNFPWQKAPPGVTP